MKDSGLVLRLHKNNDLAAGFISGAVSLKGASLAYVDGGAGEDTITDSELRFLDAGLAVGDAITTANSTTAGNDLVAVILTGVTAGTLSFASGSLVGGVDEAFDAATTLISDGATGYSKPIALGRLSGGASPSQMGSPTEIGFVISNVSNGGFTGSFQACIAQDNNDYAGASGAWQDIDGIDFATSWATGGASSIKAPYTHLRAKVLTGHARIDLASTSTIVEV